MAFCKYCGKQLADNETCNCRTSRETYAPDIDSDGIGQNTDTSAAETKKTKNKKYLIIPAVLLAAAVLLAGISYSAGSYKRPLKNIVRGINKNNIELILKQVMTDDMLEDFKENAVDDDEDWKDFCDDANDGIEELKEYIEDDFGKHFKVSAEILSKTEAKKREIKSLEKVCDSRNMDCTIKKAYKLKTELKFKGRDEEKNMKLYVYSVKLKDDGWKIMLDEETLDDFEYNLDDIIDTKVYREIADDIFTKNFAAFS